MSNDRGSSLTSTPGLVGIAASGFILGLAAHFGRKAIVQGISAAQGEWDEGLKAEHRLTLKIFDAIERTSEKNRKKRAMLLVQLKHALSKHAFAEETIVYPAMRDHGQVEQADQLIHDHGYVKQYLFDLTELSSADPAWIGKLRAFRTELEAHIRAEEDELFPALRAALGKEGNAHITAAVNKAGFVAA